jgi:peptide deformylase
MINPKIIKASEKMISTKSNCGSIKYREKITVKRHASIEVRYYDLEGNHWDETFTGKNGGFTIQHEIDHNNGIMITDRYLEQGGDPKLLEKI